jgi:nitroimidazol reductase NimA-like FMN-containing flavoprotein (pyridoxamine 5'-phosphate oxidase superfamily)
MYIKYRNGLYRVLRRKSDRELAAFRGLWDAVDYVKWNWWEPRAGIRRI